MASSTSVSPDMRDMAQQAADDAREGAREMGKAASEASGNMQRDLQALRDDFGRLAEQVADILTDKGGNAWRRARSGIDDALSGAQDTGRDAVGAMREVSDNFMEAVDDSLKTRPYATLAMVAGLAFLFGATWRR